MSQSLNVVGSMTSGREGGKERGERGREGEREGGREGRREGGREGEYQCTCAHVDVSTLWLTDMLVRVP